MNISPPFEIRFVPWKMAGMTLLMCALTVFVAASAWADVATPEAFADAVADAVANAPHRRKVHPLEFIQNRYLYGALMGAGALCAAGLSAVGVWVTATAGRPALAFDGDRVVRITPWGRAEVRLAPGSVLTLVRNALSIDPPATVVATTGRAAKLGASVPRIAMTWWLADTSAKQMQLFLDRQR